MKNSSAKSPLMNEPIQLLETIAVSSLGIRWAKSLNKNIDRLFRELQQKKWYYQRDKWEFDIALSFVDPGSEVLEIGCGEGFFLGKAMPSCKRAIGLELNPEAVRDGLAKGLDVREMSVQDFASDHSERFDVVTSFQVMEHVTVPKEIIAAQVRCLKKGGKLIVSVPNNDGFYGKVSDINNLPPHHMIRWTERSLLYLEQLYDLKVVQVLREPLRKEHVPLYCWSKYRDWRKDLRSSGFLKKLKSLFALLESKFMMSFSRLYSKQAGHTILVIFEKI